MRARTDCAGLVAAGSIRINRQPTAKPHAKLRIGDVLTIPVRGTVRVVQVAQLGVRRGPATEARQLYLDLAAGDNVPDATRGEPNDLSATSCIATDSSAYRAP